MGIQHRFPAFAILVAALLHVLPATAQDKVVLLDGSSLLVDDVFRVAVENYQVTIAPSAMDLMKKSHELLLAAGEQGIPIYGLNRGVGLNKDKRSGRRLRGNSTKTIYAPRVRAPARRRPRPSRGRRC
jgi:hypothetical protein